MRRSFTHACRLATYNWPLYGFAIVACLLGGVVAAEPTISPVIRVMAAIGAFLAGWFALASFAAFHWMFDRSRLLDGHWLLDLVKNRPQNWVQLSACLEQTTLPLDVVFPDASGQVIDLFDPAVTTEPALMRARQGTAVSNVALTKTDALPIGTGEADLVVVTLFAHEIRDRLRRRRLFTELRRIISQSGSVVLVEHLRNLPAALAFGPGLFHFYPRSEWLRLATQAGLVMRCEDSMTPFVHVFCFGVIGLRDLPVAGADDRVRDR